jgi:hypothetical protein
MIENIYIDNFETFFEWYKKINPEEAPDMHEAMNIFFNLEDYEILGV